MLPNFKPQITPLKPSKITDKVVYHFLKNTPLKNDFQDLLKPKPFL